MTHQATTAVRFRCRLTGDDEVQMLRVGAVRDVLGFAPGTAQRVRSHRRGRQ